MSARSIQLAIAPRLMLGTILAIGLLAAWFFAWMMVDTLFRTSSGFKQLVYTADGEPLVSTYPEGNRELVEPIYHTLDGRLVPNSSEVVLLDDYPQEVRPERERPEFEAANPFVNWQMGMLGFAALSPTRTYWYLIHDFEADGSAYFVGYDALTRLPIGYFGRRGFAAAPPAPKDRFQITLSLFVSGGWQAHGGARGTLPNYDPQRRYNILLISGDELLKINLSTQAVSPIPLPGKAISLGSYIQHLSTKDRSDSEEQSRIVVRLPDELRLLDEQGEPLGRLPLPPNLRDKVLSLRSVKPEEILVESWPESERYTAHEITWFGAEGNVLGTQR